MGTRLCYKGYFLPHLGLLEDKKDHASQHQVLKVFLEGAHTDIVS